MPRWPGFPDQVPLRGYPQSPPLDEPGWTPPTNLYQVHLPIQVANPIRSRALDLQIDDQSI